MPIENYIANRLIQTQKTLSLAESCTGGLVSHRLTNVPGSSLFLTASIIAYSNQAKTRILKVAASTIKKHGAVSVPTAVAMAKGVRKLGKSDFGLSITGIAGPSGGTKQKPVGLTYICICSDLESLCVECHFTGSRNRIKTQAATQALNLFGEFLS